MKALTIYQPWASLIMLGAKPFEFRHWDYRTRERALEGQRIVIHASARAIKAEEIHDILARIEDGESSLDPTIAKPLCDRLLAAYRCQGVLELAAGLGTAILGKPRRVGELFGGHPDSDRLNHHLWAWPLSNIERFPEPIPMRGAQGFWAWSAA